MVRECGEAPGMGVKSHCADKMISRLSETAYMFADNTYLTVVIVGKISSRRESKVRQENQDEKQMKRK